MELGDDDKYVPVSPPSFKTKVKHSFCFYCCFRRHHHGRHNRYSHRRVLDSPPGPPPPPSDEKPTLLWLKTRAPHDLKDDIMDKCMTVFGRGGNGSNRHKRHPSAEFRYDPLSYSLNFEDGFDDDDEYQLRNFSARLPPSQPAQAMPTVREIAAIS